MRSRWFSVVWVALLLCFGQAALAQDDKAQKLFSEAELYFKASKFEKAADLYTEAFVASQIPDLLFNVAQCYRNLKRYEDTLKTFKQYVNLVSASDEDLVENLVGLKKIQALLPELENEDDFPKKSANVKKLLKDTKDLIGVLLTRAATLPRPSALSITGTTEANVFLDDIKLEGKTPLDILKAKKGSHKLSVTKDGYFPWNKSFDVNGEGKAISFLVELVPLVLEVQGTPGADVIINGELKGKIPFRLEGVKAGAYRLSVRMVGHTDWSSDVILPGKDQEPIKLNAELNPILLKVDGPADAELSLDGDLQGKLPATVEKISAGKHKLTVRMSGFEEWTSEVVITNDKALYEQKVVLRPVQVAKKGSGGSSPEAEDKSAAAFALYGTSAVAVGGGVIALVSSLKAKKQGVALLELGQPDVIDLVTVLDKQSKQLGVASIGAFALAAGAGVGGFVLSKKSSSKKSAQLQLTPTSVAVSGRF